ncbi:MAG TPA: hypothetical protein DCL21_03740 [Alphaproteobacteria bacterium]|nr:hypothetical protein [Alphaproteobacteria bacterium]
MLNKGAMFGLDARIALAIFGALSVISGAALYSAIQHAKVTAIATEITEVAKAVEQFMLDTGQDIPHITEADKSKTSDLLYTDHLISSTVQGWKGPYLAFTDTGSNNDRIEIDRNEPKNIIILRASNKTWGGLHTVAANFTDWSCAGAIKCHMYVLSEWYDNRAFVEALDKYFDGVVDYNSGRLRVREWDNLSPVKFTVYYEIGPMMGNYG